MSEASPPKKARVEREHGASEETMDIFNMSALSGASMNLFATEVLDDEDSSDTNDAPNSDIIYSAARPPSQKNDEVSSSSSSFCQPWEAVHSLPSVAHFAPEIRRIVADFGTLPPVNGVKRLTLVLDLDETLVHSSVENENFAERKADFSFPVDLDGTDFVVHCNKRPGCDAFLRACKDLGFEMCIFTASKSVYADSVLDLLDPSGELLGGREFRLFREHCIGYRGNYLKNLQVLKRDLSQTVIVDNSPNAFALHSENGIPIQSWFDDEKDEELFKLTGFLKTLINVDDVRPLLMRQFGPQ